MLKLLALPHEFVWKLGMPAYPKFPIYRPTHSHVVGISYPAVFYGEKTIPII